LKRFRNKRIDNVLFTQDYFSPTEENIKEAEKNSYINLSDFGMDIKSIVYLDSVKS